MRGEFYRMEYEAWDEGTDEMSLEQEAAYLRLCHQMYRRGGPVPESLHMLARIWRCHPNKARKLLESLLGLGKVSRTSNGCLTNNRVTQELDHRDTVRRQRADAGQTGGTRSGEIRRKPLKTNGAGEALASDDAKQNEARARDKKRGEERRGDIQEKEIGKEKEGGAPSETEERKIWALWLRAYARTGHWDGDGPEPDDPGCRAPPDLLEQFRAERAAA